jgi:hypothetical protein
VIASGIDPDRKRWIASVVLGEASCIVVNFVALGTVPNFWALPYNSPKEES